MNVAAVSGTGSYSYAGTAPDYNATTGVEPNGDLGYGYLANSAGTGGMDYSLNFKQGGSSFANDFVINDFRLMIYDVDGESFQSESVAVSTADGFYGYRLPTTNDITLVEDGSGLFTFSGPGTNRDENDPSAAVILFFRNTSSLTLQMRSNTTASSPLPNIVFSAIDGDLSLLGATGESAFGSFTAVPEPSSLLLGTVGMLALCNRRSRG